MPVLRLLVLAVSLVVGVGGSARADGYVVYDKWRGVFGAAFDRGTPTAAREAAIRACHANGGKVCNTRLSIGSGSCGALAVQTTHKRTGKRLSRQWYADCAKDRKCWPGYSLYRGGTLAAAKSKTMANCTKYGFQCKFVLARCTR